MDPVHFAEGLAMAAARRPNLTTTTTSQMRQKITEGNDVALRDIVRLFYRAAMANKWSIILFFVLLTLVLIPVLKVYFNGRIWAIQGRDQLREYYDDLALENSWVRRLERDWVSFTTGLGRIYLQLTNNWYVDRLKLLCQEIRIIYSNIMSAWWLVFPALLVCLISMCLWNSIRGDVPLTKWEDLPSAIGSGMPEWLRAERKTQGSNSHHMSPTGVRYDDWVQSGPIRRHGEVIDILDGEGDVIRLSTKDSNGWQSVLWKTGEKIANIIPDLTITETVLHMTPGDTETSGGTMSSSTVRTSSIPEVSNVAEHATKTLVHHSSTSPKSDATERSDDADSTHVHEDSSSERLSDKEYWAPPKRKTAVSSEELTWCRQCQQFHCCELPY